MFREMAQALLSQPVVIDNGTGVMKAGLAGGDKPTVVFAATCGRAKHARVMPGGARDAGAAGTPIFYRGKENFLA